MRANDPVVKYRAQKSMTVRRQGFFVAKVV